MEDGVRAARANIGYRGRMFFFLSKILDVLLSPLTWGVVLLAAAVPWRGGQARSPWRRCVFGALGIAIFLAFSAFPFSNALLRGLERSAPSTYHADVVYDAVILLGGVNDEIVSTERHGPAYNDNVERLLATYDLLREGKARFAVVSGGGSGGPFEDGSDGRYLTRQLERWGIAPERLVVEAKARNTRENAVFAKEIADQREWTRVLVVTSAFHMARASECFEAVGMKADFLPVDFRSREAPYGVFDLLPRASALELGTMVVREWLGRYIYRFQGYAKAIP